MELDRPTKIGLKHVGTGFLAFIIVLLITQFLFPSPTGIIGATFAIMSVMVISASKEAYRIGEASSNVRASADN